MHMNSKLRSLAAAALALAVSLAPAVSQAQEAAVEIAPADGLADIPRNQTLILGWSTAAPVGVTNPWSVLGYTHQEGNQFMWEPLMYFGIFKGKGEYVPWLAESMEYTSDDFTSLQIKLNPAARWSDGVPVTAADVVFTFEGQMTNNRLAYHASFEQFVESVTAVDDHTVDVAFKIPAPRFKFDVLTLKFGTSTSPIVPKHHLEQQADVSAYAGGVEIPHSGPYRLIAWNQTQKIYDYRDDWWGIEAGLMEVPDVKRIIMANIGGVVGQNMDVVAQRLVTNEFDSALDMRSSVIGNILAQNPEITTHTGNASPYGYLDWWPNALWMNTQLEPFNDVRVRRAVSLVINREVIDDVLYEGENISTIYPFPLYPNLEAFANTPAVKAFEEKYQPALYDPAQSEALMTEAGFTRNGDGMWEKDGETINGTIQAFEGIHGDIGPILVEMLRNGGFDASINFGTDSFQQMVDGAPGFYLFGHVASLLDPYAAFELFHGRFSVPVGEATANYRLSRYSNPEFDAILDQMAPLGSDDPKFLELGAQLMEIYWRDQINVPVIQWLHRIAYNQHYWTNWPTADNVLLGQPGGWWAHTGMLVALQLEATGAE
jgi:peptide/nickel transport system substrate-binding protein